MNPQDLSQLGIQAYRTETGRTIVKSPFHRGVFNITDPTALQGIPIQNVTENTLGQFIGGTSADNLSASQFMSRILPEVQGNIRNQQLQQQQVQEAQSMNSFLSQNANTGGKEINLPSSIDPTGRYSVIDGRLVTRGIQAQQQQQQQQIASGQQVQIGTSPTGVPLYAPTGSTATTNQLGIQQPQTQQVQPPQGQVQIGTSPSGQPLYAPVGSPAALLQQQKQPPAGTQPQQETIQYTVKPYDTLSQIAAQLGVNWKTDITGFKSGDPDLIFPGEVLTIKKAFTPTPSTDLPPPEPKDTDVGGAGDTTPPPPEQTNPLTPAEEDYSKVLQQRSYDDYVDSFSKKLGLDDLKKQLGDLNLALEAAKQKGINRRNDINNNPWISEELRGRKIANADRASKEEESLALEQFNLAQKQYNNAREEIKFAAQMAVDQQNEDREFYFKVKEESRKARESTLKEGLTAAQIEATEALEDLRRSKISAPEVTKPSTQILNIDGKKYLVDKTTGNIIKQIKPGEEVPPSPPTPITPTIPTGKQVIETRKPGLIAKKPGFLSRIKQFFKGKKKRTKITKTQSAISPASAISWDDF